MKNRKFVILFNIIAVLVFLYLPVLFAPHGIGFLEMFNQPIGIAEMTTYFLLITYFYINYYVLVPYLYFNKKYLMFALISLLVFAVIMLVPTLIVALNMDEIPAFFQGPPHGHEDHHMHNPSLFFGFRQNFLVYLLVFAFSLMLKINARWKHTEQLRVSAELSHLKAQVNPHFLFNTLNSIYSLALEKSEETPNAVVRLSDMMRYVISEADKDFVSLDKEIKYICDYIDFQKIRLGSTTQLNFSVEGETSGKQIAPLVLIPFVENAFKYGVNPEENATISIRILLEDGRLDMIVKNDKVNRMLADSQKSGLGIQNTKKRLQNIYPSRHLLNIRETDREFIVTLNLVLE